MEVEKILQAIAGLKNDFNQKFDDLSGQVGNLSGRFDTLSGEVGDLSGRFDTLSSQVQENTQILKALEHLAQVNKAEHDNMSFNISEIHGDIAEIRSDIKTIKKDLSTVELITANNWGDIARLKSVK